MKWGEARVQAQSGDTELEPQSTEKPTPSVTEGKRWGGSHNPCNHRVHTKHHMVTIGEVLSAEMTPHKTPSSSKL